MCPSGLKYKKWIQDMPKLCIQLTTKFSQEVEFSKNFADPTISQKSFILLLTKSTQNKKFEITLGYNKRINFGALQKKAGS
jgi:hypothetical protein